MTTAAPISSSAVIAAEDAVRALAKALRARQMYLPNNPTRIKAIDAARLSMAKLWEHAPKLELEVRESSFAWNGVVVYEDLERTREGLPWLLYRDGIRQLTLDAGCEHASLDTLLEIFQTARSATATDDDLVTLLWVTDLPDVHYRHVELYDNVDAVDDAERLSRASMDEIDENGGGTRPALAMAAMESEDVRAGTTLDLIRTEDFESTLHFLDPREVAYLQSELDREYAGNPRRRAFAILLDIIELPNAAAQHAKVLDIIDALVVECLATRDFDAVAFVLHEAAATRQRAALPGDVGDSLARLPARLSAPAVVEQLLQLLEEAKSASDVSTVELLITELEPSALQPLTAWLSANQHAQAVAHPIILRAAVRLAVSSTAVLSRLLESSDSTQLQGAILVAFHVASPATVPGLSRILRDAEPPLRIAAVAALAAIGSPNALQALERGLEDSDRDVRMATYRALMERRSGAALPRIANRIRQRPLRFGDLAEKVAVFEVYGALCGDAGVPELDKLLNARGFLGPKESPETRACAAMSLGLVGTPASWAALQRAAEAKDAVVRSAVSRALRGGDP